MSQFISADRIALSPSHRERPVRAERPERLERLEQNDHGERDGDAEPIARMRAPARDRDKEREKEREANRLASPVATAAPLPFGVSPHISPLVHGLIALKGQILHELENHLPKLLTLNPSRREAIAQYLDRLAGQPAGPSLAAGSTDPAAGLRRWVDGARTPAQAAALRTYFEEVALVVLGQAILLKAWSDRGLRAWSESDIGRLNWVLNTALKSQIPLDREGWQVTRANIYSWYNPSVPIQREIWSSLESRRIADEGPGLLVSLSGPIRQARSEGARPQGYDSRFFQSLWERLPAFGFDPNPDSGPLKRHRMAFSPTLRDGALVRTGSPRVQWIGLEESAFQLMMAELVQLWWGPAAPPLWAIGSGLEVHTRDQLSLALGSARPSLLSRIAEMEACDVAFVLEERAVKAHGRGTEAQRLREQLEQLPWFKKLRAPGTSLGALQACVALTKLRPGGLMLWAREDALSASDGTEMLGFLLEKAKLVCEWDFSELAHQLPASLALFPRHLYLFSREHSLESRLTHRPLRVHARGTIRSHVEVPMLLETAFASAASSPDGHPPGSAPGTTPGIETSAHGQWTLHVSQSPTAQQEWAERWPDPAAQNILLRLENLRAASLPLANVTTIRPTPEGDPAKEHQWSVHDSLKGFWIRSTCMSPPEGKTPASSTEAAHAPRLRKLVAEPLPRSGRPTKGTGFLILIADDSWNAPLSAWLESDAISDWLDHRAERRGDRWMLNDQAIKWIPVPRSLVSALGAPGAAASDHEFALPLPGEWEKTAAAISYKPSLVRDAIKRLAPDHPAASEIRSALFVRTARALERVRGGVAAAVGEPGAPGASGARERFAAMVTPDGRIRWRELLGVLPASECVAVPFHSRIRMTGNLPAHLPIGSIERVRMPSPGILLATEQGFNLHLASDSAMLLDMVWEQLDGLTHPTWNELLSYLRLPRRVELAEETASDVLRSHGEQELMLRELCDLLHDCTIF